MKLIILLGGVLLLSVSVLSFYGDDYGDEFGEEEFRVRMGREPDCDKYGNAGCPKLFEPLCASNGRTYTNECLLCQEIRKTSVAVKVIAMGQC